MACLIRSHALFRNQYGPTSFLTKTGQTPSPFTYTLTHRAHVILPELSLFMTFWTLTAYDQRYCYSYLHKGSVGGSGGTWPAGRVCCVNLNNMNNRAVTVGHTYTLTRLHQSPDLRRRKAPPLFSVSVTPVGLAIQSADCQEECVQKIFYPKCYFCFKFSGYLTCSRCGFQGSALLTVW